MSGGNGPNLTTALPASRSQAVTPSDTVDLAYAGGKVKTRGISVGAAGNVAYKNEAGDSQLATGLAAGVLHPIAAVRILVTGTTATGITAHW